MKIGLILCDHVNNALVERHGDYPDMFRVFLQIMHPDINCVVYDATQNMLPMDVHECDAYIISGSQFGVNDPLPWIRSIESFICHAVAAQKKLIGFCFGHQLIAKALGGKVIRAPQGWCVGVATNQVCNKSEWLTPEKVQFRAYVHHQDQIVELPDNTTILANNPKCSHFMLRIGEHTLTMQGHPEFDKSYTKSLMGLRQKLYQQNDYQEGLKTLVNPVDTKLMAQWLYQFLE